MARHGDGKRGGDDRSVGTPGTPADRSVARLRTDSERAAHGAAAHYSAVRGLSTPPEEAYLAALPEARRDIARRFVGGLLRGAPDELAEPVVLPRRRPSTGDPDGREPPGAGRATDPMRGVSATDLLDELRPLSDRCRSVAFLPFPASGAVVVAQIEAIHGYDRYRLTGDVRVGYDDGDRRAGTADGAVRVERLDHPVELVPHLDREGAFVDASQSERVASELAESVANLALARLADRVARRRAAESSDAFAAVHELRAADATSALERIVTGGHPFHYGAKLRRGMSPAAALTYAPEFAGRVDVRFAAIRRDRALHVTADDGIRDEADGGGPDDGPVGVDATDGGARDAENGIDRVLYGAFDGLEDAVERAIPSGSSPSAYVPVPIHPWQYHRVLPERYEEHLADGRLALVDGYAHPATPLCNLRTVVPFATETTGPGPLPHLKLAIGVQTTNVVRTLSPQAVWNGPRLSAAISSVLARESFDALGILGEPAAACYHAPGGPHPEGPAFDDARHCSGLVRRNPLAHPLVDEGTIPVTVSSLLAASPATGRPVVDEVVDRFAAAEGIADDARATRRFLDAYVGVVVPEHLVLLSAYGIALESHAQNCCVVLEEETGRPVAALVRDLGGIRALDERLAPHDLGVDVYPRSDVAADGEVDLYLKLYYALFQNHLAELIATLVRRRGVDEDACWEIVREHAAAAFERVRARPDVPDERVERDRAALLADPIDHKALTAMRLRGKRHEYVTSEVSNPLAAASDLGTGVDGSGGSR